MAIDFTLTPQLEPLRDRGQTFIYKDHGTTKATTGNLPI